MLFLCTHSERLPLQEREFKYCFGIILKFFFLLSQTLLCSFLWGGTKIWSLFSNSQPLEGSKAYIKLAPVANRRKRVLCLHGGINKVPSGSV